MDTRVEKNQTKIPVKTEGESPTTLTTQITPPTPQPSVTPTPTITDPVQKQLTQLLADIITDLQDLAFEIAVCEDETVLKHPITKIARRLTKKLRDLYNIFKKTRMK